ncbi:MAG TPA: protein-glutamate O-methyltransferase CheR [Verrucomicrobiae bacterium]|nr:protein-glutamate O-methyltransferase CheR [Verrucomicrobiae bacterium]
MGTPRLTAPPSDGITPENYAFLEQYIHRESGILLGPDKLYLLKSRLQQLLQQERLGSLDQLCEHLRKSPTESLRRKIVESMTTHETLFFRDPAVFEMLRKDLLPELAKSRSSSRSLRIWSAACSSGQEPYSLAMTILESGFADWKVEIVGTDLSSQILERAAGGTYLQIEVNRGLPAPLLIKYFQRVGLDWRIQEPVRRMVRFTSFDLRQNMSSFPQFDLILCRNVLIYFEIETRKKILAGLRSRLVPGGYLLLGASETTFNIDDSFVRRTIGNSIVYQAPPEGGKR